MPLTTIPPVPGPTETKTETDAGAVPSKAVPVEAAAAVVPADLDGTSSSQIELLLQDLERETESRIKSIEERAAQAVEEQREAAFLGSIRLDRSVKAMTLGEFSERHGGDVLAEVLAAFRSGGEGAAAGKKRVRRGERSGDGDGARDSGPEGPGRRDRPDSRHNPQDRPEGGADIVSVPCRAPD